MVKKEGNPDSLSAAQKTMLQISEDDIKNGRLIPQEELDKKDMEWLQLLTPCCHPERSEGTWLR